MAAQYARGAGAAGLLVLVALAARHIWVYREWYWEDVRYHWARVTSPFRPKQPPT